MDTNIHALIDELSPLIREISRQVHQFREIRFEEHQSSHYLQKVLADQGFLVQSRVAGMDTAFIAKFGTGQPHIGLFAEFDALPEIGHACGHNLIAASSVGAAIVLARWLQTNPTEGQIWLVGSPGEEGGGGKIRLVEAGVLDSLTAGLMFHPAALDEVAPVYLFREGIDVQFYGRAAHFAGGPEHGINALDAMLSFFQFLAQLRGHIAPEQRVHGLITHGGSAPNVVPEFTSARILVRARDESEMKSLFQRVVKAAEAAALGTGCTTKWERFVPAYQDVRQNPALARLIAQALKERGRSPVVTEKSLGSTDMGNVSYRVPSIHANIGLGQGLVPHTREFEQAAVSPEADQAALDAAYALARTAIVLLQDPSLITSQTGP